MGLIWVKFYLESWKRFECLTSKKVTRREAIKTMAAAAAVVLAVPHLGKLPASERGTSTVIQKTSKLSSEDEPFIVLVGKDGVKGFKGLEEYTLNDATLREGILRAFSGAGAK